MQARFEQIGIGIQNLEIQGFGLLQFAPFVEVGSLPGHGFQIQQFHFLTLAGPFPISVSERIELTKADVLAAAKRSGGSAKEKGPPLPGALILVVPASD